MRRAWIVIIGLILACAAVIRTRIWRVAVSLCLVMQAVSLSLILPTPKEKAELFRLDALFGHHVTELIHVVSQNLSRMGLAIRAARHFYRGSCQISRKACPS